MPDEAPVITATRPVWFVAVMATTLHAKEML
jgi:hypothetical protein